MPLSDMKKIAASENVLAATDPPAPRGAVCYYQSWRCAVVTVVAVAFLFRSGAEAVDATACNDTTDTAGSSRFCPEGQSIDLVKSHFYVCMHNLETCFVKCRTRVWVSTTCVVEICVWRAE